MLGRNTTVCLCFVVLFLVLTIGPTGICALFLIAGALLAGLFAGLYLEGNEHRLTMKRNFGQWKERFRFSQGLKFARHAFPFSDESIYAERHSMTNSQVLDPILEQILSYIMRDYVDSWYNVHITLGTLFQASLKRTARRTIIAFRTCLSKVNWVPLLTRHMIDDFASHLRLYRKAKERLQLQKELDSSKLGRAADDLESLFFDLELEMEKSYCRDLVSTSQAYESAYLHDICDILLYLLMPSEDFRCRPLRFLIREVFVTKVFVPLLDRLSDPCFVNRMIVWFLSELPISTNDFVSSLETCKYVQELEAILESVHEEMNSLRSKGGNAAVENGNIFSQQLVSLEFTENLIRQRMMLLANANKPEEDQQTMKKQKRHFGQSLDMAEDASSLDNDPIIHLPITVVLTHPVALAHFVEFLNQVGGQNFIDFYLAIEGFKTSLDHQVRSLASGDTLDTDAHETLKEAALFMYHQYLSQEAITRVPLGDSLINKFLARLRNNFPSDLWFDEVQQKITEILRNEDRFYPNFKRHRLYEKMLEELGIGVMPIIEDDMASLPEGMCEDLVSFDQLGRDETSSISDETLLQNMKMNESADAGNMVHIEMLGVGHQGRHLFALYNVRVSRANSSSNVIRRYSDFHTLHSLILAKFPNLRTLSFPGKKTFNNLDQAFLDKRCSALNQYMNCLLQPSLLSANPGLEQLVSDFLSQKLYTGRESFPKAMSTMLFNNPIVSGVKAFGNAAASMPSDLMDGIGKAATNMLKGNPNKQRIQRGLSASSSTSKLPDSSRVAALIDEKDTSDNIPLRVLLLVVDEVFGLRAKNQWFRRRLVSLLRQFINHAMGNSINRRIIDAVHWLTSEEQVAQYLIALRESLWSDVAGAFSEQALQQDSQRTRFLARCLMLSAVPDELRLFIGTSTIQAGVENVSEALQNSHLNRRFWFVILERLLITIFPNNHFNRLLPQLHAKSPRSQMA